MLNIFFFLSEADRNMMLRADFTIFSFLRTHQFSVIAGC